MNCVFINAQDLYVSSLAGSDALPVNEVTAILQDQDGYIWFGTSDGLCRYDGYNIKVLRSDFLHPNLLQNNHIFTLAEDKCGNIWFSTKKGIYVLNKSTYNNKLLNIDDFPQRSYTLIRCTQDGHIWIGGTSKLYHFDKKGSLLSRTTLKSDVASFYEDRYGNLFMAVYNDGLYCKPKEKQEFKMICRGFIPTCMSEDINNSHYIACEDGVFKLSYDPLLNKEAKLEKLPYPKDDNGNNIGFFTHIIQDDSQHNLWLLSYYRGVVLIDSQGKQLPVPSKVKRNTDQMMNYLYKDHKGRLWLSGFNVGCIILSWGNNSISNVNLNGLEESTPTVSSIRNLFRDDGGVFWGNQERKGLFLYDETTSTTKSYTDNPTLKALQLYQIKFITPADNKNEAWVAYYGNRIAKIHRDGMSFTLKETIDLQDYSQTSGEIECLLQDGSGNLWIGSENGLFVRKNNSSDIDSIINTNRDISDIKHSPSNTIWFGFTEGGIGYLESESGIPHIIETDWGINSINCSDKHYVWVATTDGRCMRYNIESKQWDDYTKLCGLNGNSVNDILLDKSGKVWLISNQQINVFNPKDNSLDMISTSEENVSVQRFIPHSIYYDEQSQIMYVGGVKGILKIDLAKWKSSNTKLSDKVYITDIRSSNSSIWFDSLRHENGLDLYPDDRNVTFYFSNLNILNTATTRYAYRMIGLNDEWIELEAGKNQAVFNNLPKGHYTLQVKTIPSNGESKPQVSDLKIYRHPAWYESPLAYIVYSIMTICALYYIIRLYKNRLKERSEKKLSEQMIQTKLSYFTNISHELLTPLAVISSINESMETPDEITENKKSLISSNISRLKYLLQQILDFRKAESGNMKLYVDKNNLCRLVEQRCHESFIPLAQNKNIRITMEKPMEDIIGYFDTDKIDKILFNLVSNAIKYTHEDKRVTIRIEEEQRGNTTFAVISVEDEGIGIDSREQNKIFSRFYNSSGINPSESNGIGLSLTKTLIELHHGTIMLHSQKGKGSIFTINFPIDRNAYTNLEIKDRKQDEQIGLLRREISNMHINREPSSDKSLLIVEDNIDMLTALDELLSKHYYTFTATNGNEALEIMSEHPEISFVVSDISMPDMDGIELCSRIKGNINSSHIIVVMLTAMVTSDKQVDSYNAGADGYMPKPFESKVLLALLNNLWKQRIAQQESFRKNPLALQVNNLEMAQLDRNFVERAISVVKKNLSSENFDVEFLARELAMSRSTLSRKIKAITGDTPLDFIKSVKFKYAYQLLQKHTMSIIEVAEAIGYNDRHTFSTSFKDMFGISPSKV